MPNKLAAEKSPYLLQHADNPVQWYPWSEEALATAKREDKPILVSIGYSACHWCHVMAHESFENQSIADLMNRNFINIKVDREERPDVDAIYMEAVQAMSGHGGWPLNVFLTPEGKPFFGGTYFPPEPGRGMASWPQVLESVVDAYRERRSDVLHNANTLTDYVRKAQRLNKSEEALSPELLRAAFEVAVRQIDGVNGGFGMAPKFPQPLSLELLLRMQHRFGDERALRFVELTLTRMANGGIFDQLAGGFHRYSVDAAWIVPHFEKMLYDNALLASTYLQAFQVTRNTAYRRVVEETLDYLLREMRSPEGGFYSAEDADSESVEGKFYVWMPSELQNVLNPDQYQAVMLRYGITAEGNFEGKNILTASMSFEEVAERLGTTVEEVEGLLSQGRSKLLAARSERVRPGKDTKILVSWNALAIRALTQAARVLEKPEYLSSAEQAANFILDRLRPSGRLVRSYKDGPSAIFAFLEDYAFLVEALLTLYETSFDETRMNQAEELVQEMVNLFWDDLEGGFFDVANDVQELVVRPRSFFDNPIPSGNAAATFALLRMHALTGSSKYEERALPAFRSTRELLPRAPLGFGYLLSALDFYLSPQVQIAIVGRADEVSTQEMAREVFDRYLPNMVMAVGEDANQPLLAGRTRLDGKPTAYLCEHFACRLPVNNRQDWAKQLDVISGSSGRGPS